MMAEKEGKKMNNLENMSVQELEQLKNQIDNLIKSKKSNSQSQLILYTHNCKDSAKYHKNKYKHWSKLVTAVDVTKTNGYAFIGDFLNISNEHKLPINSIVVEVCHTTIIAYRLQEDGKCEIGSASTNAMSSLIEKLAGNLKGDRK